MTDTESTTRAERILGLRLLADFLDEHPSLPAPADAWMYLRFEPAGHQQVAAGALLGTGKLNIEHDGYQVTAYGRFAGLRGGFVFRPDMIGEVREVPGLGTEFLLYTVAELSARAAAAKSVPDESVA